MAVNYLISKGHMILERGYRSKTGEIDIISYFNGCIHFVEVKTRTSFNYGHPREAVSKDKLRHIKNTAEMYIKLMKSNSFDNSREYEYSIDVVEVMLNHLEGVY